MKFAGPSESARSSKRMTLWKWACLQRACTHVFACAVGVARRTTPPLLPQPPDIWAWRDAHTGWVNLSDSLWFFLFFCPSVRLRCAAAASDAADPIPSDPRQDSTQLASCGGGRRWHSCCFSPGRSPGTLRWQPGWFPLEISESRILLRRIRSQLTFRSSSRMTPALLALLLGVVSGFPLRTLRDTAG